MAPAADTATAPDAEKAPVAAKVAAPKADATKPAPADADAAKPVPADKAAMQMEDVNAKKDISDKNIDEEVWGFVNADKNTLPH